MCRFSPECAGYSQSPKLTHDRNDGEVAAQPLHLLLPTLNLDVIKAFTARVAANDRYTLTGAWLAADWYTAAMSRMSFSPSSPDVSGVLLDATHSEK